MDWEPWLSERKIIIVPTDHAGAQERTRTCGVVSAHHVLELKYCTLSRSRFLYYYVSLIFRCWDLAGYSVLLYWFRYKCQSVYQIQ